MYGSGFFDLTPLPVDGAPASAAPLTEAVSVDMPGFGILDTFTILIDGTTEVTPEFMGLTPGAVGLDQINFAVPSLAAGTHQVQIKQDHRQVSPFNLPDDIYLSKPVLLYRE